MSVARDLSKVTRIEVIDEGGRAYTRWNVSLEESIQDDGRIMKIIVKSKGTGAIVRSTMPNQPA